jgi:peptidoglycan hydrolase CwlO-like protein
MAKRSTIGENPLDVVRSESPLDAVVPGPSAPAVGRPHLPAEVLQRLERLESGLKNAGAEGAQLKGELAALKSEGARDRAELAQLKPELARLAAELAALRDELNQLQAALRTPSDLPWWMRGRKK